MYFKLNDGLIVHQTVFFYAFKAFSFIKLSKY